MFVLSVSRARESRSASPVTQSLISRVRQLGRRDGAERAADATQAPYVCHCKHVHYADVDKAIRKGARSMADIQRATTACTRCFGCRFELERMLQDAYGDAYHRQSTITLPDGVRGTRLPRSMYMPVLAGFRGYDVDTRVIVFNWEGPAHPIGFRADLLTLDGTRVQAIEHSVASGSSAILDFRGDEAGSRLPGGVGVVKLILETEEVGSLRPYFHLLTPTCISSTHEKKGPADPAKLKERNYHWIFPIGKGRRNDEAYFFYTNTQAVPMEGQRLVWQSTGGAVESTELPTLEFSQSACIPLHERFETLNAGEGGAVRLDPPLHAVAGFMLRHEPEAQLWRVQHL
jgi:bacterioferritin-associated ferredoxin